MGKNTKFLSVSIFVFMIVIFGFFAYYFVHPQPDPPTSAATVTESFTFGSSHQATVTYDNTYGTIESVTGNIGVNFGLKSLTINTTLNSGYSWSASSCTIAITGFNSKVINVQFTRNNNHWANANISSLALFAAGGITFTFPFEDLVERSSYSISYNLNGGSYGTYHPSTYTSSSNSQSITISNPARGGYTFSSWSLSWSGSGTRPSISGTSLTIPANTTGNITLTANWTARSYTITINLNGGNVSGSPPTSYSTSTSARSYTIATPTRDYYNFTGWAISRSSSGGAAPTISGTTLSIPANSYGNITLTANWELQKFNLTFRSNNTALGYVTPAMESSPQNALASYSSTATTVHPLAEFLWWTDENGTIISYEETITIPSLTANTIRIAVFRANGTAVTAYSGGEVRARSNGEQVTLTAIPYAGCAFSSWVVANGTLTLENPNSSTITLPLAMLNGVVLRPTFTGGTAVTNSPLAKASTGGEVRMNATTLNGTDYIHLSALTFAGYEFTGWTAQTSSGEAIDLSAYGATCDIPMSLVEGVIIIANFTEKPSINHNPETDNSGGEFD